MRKLLSSPRRLGSTIFTGALVASLVPSSVVQAQSSQFAYEYQNGSIAAEAKINPLAGRLLGRILKQEIPSSVAFSATELMGAFSLPDTLPETTASIGNGSITFDSAPLKALLEPYLQQAVGQFAQRYSLPEDLGIETLESVLNYRLVGQGLLNSAGNRTAFTFEYGDEIDRLAIEGLDPAVLALCQEQTCNTELEGNFDLKLDLKGFSETSDELGLKLPGSVKRILRQAQRFGFKEFGFADGQLTSVVQVLPNLAADLAIAVGQPDNEALPGAVSPDEAWPDESLPGESPLETEAEAEVEVENLQPIVVVPALDVEADPAPDGNLRDRMAKPSAQRPGSHQLTQGDFVLTVERETAPWSLVYSVPSRK